jgi:N-acetylglutamate synthase-like GNAT family acetyltransferase
MTQPIEIIEIDTQSNWYAPELELRNQILRKPLGMNIFEEDLSDEINQSHFIALLNNRLIGCVIMVKNKENNIAKLRQMAILKEYEGMGIGSQLVRYFENEAEALGYSEIVLHARETAVGFYQKLGYQVFSEMFYEVNIPHFKMQKSLPNVLKT